MTIQEFRDYMASGKPVIGGGDVHMMFHQLSQEALKITAEINGKYHTPKQLHDLLEQLWGREVPKSVGMFPPFHTDCGKNTVIGERVFINMGCKFQDQDGNKTVLSGVPDALPSLIKAYRVQDKARNVGFDWEERRDVWKKVKEEITEFEAEVETLYNNAETDEAKAAAKQHATEEFGDVMFSLINAARLYKINPDNALEHTNQKFIHRFNYVEAKAKEKGQDLKDLTLEQMDAWWNEAKQIPTKG